MTVLIAKFNGKHTPILLVLVEATIVTSIAFDDSPLCPRTYYLHLLGTG